MSSNGNSGSNQPHHYNHHRNQSDQTTNDHLTLTQTEQDVQFFHPSPTSIINNNQLHHNHLHQNLIDLSTAPTTTRTDTIDQNHHHRSSSSTSNQLMNHDTDNHRFRPISPSGSSSSSQRSIQSNTNGAFIDHRPQPVISPTKPSPLAIQISNPLSSSAVITPSSATNQTRDLQSPSIVIQQQPSSDLNRPFLRSFTQQSPAKRHQQIYRSPSPIQSHQPYLPNPLINSSASPPIQQSQQPVSSPLPPQLRFETPINQENPLSRSTRIYSNSSISSNNNNYNNLPANLRAQNILRSGNNQISADMLASRNQKFGPTARVQAIDRASIIGSSRRPSDAASEDVCFPLLEANRVISRDQHDPRSFNDQAAITQGSGRGLAGILPQFHYPFDFQALEDFAEKERLALNLPVEETDTRKDQRGRSTSITIINQDHPSLRKDSNNRRLQVGLDGATERVEEDYKDGVQDSPDLENDNHQDLLTERSGSTGIRNRMRRARTAWRPSEGSRHGGDDNESPRFAGILKQRRLSENIGPMSNRHSTKVTIGGSTGNGNVEPGGISNGGVRRTSSPLHVSSKSPRATLKNLRNYNSNSNMDKDRSIGYSAGQERPYRFSFYSNALPSTIHARSLAELPADGQSFEELFVGGDKSKSKDLGVLVDETIAGTKDVMRIEDFDPIQRDGASDVLSRSAPVDARLFPHPSYRVGNQLGVDSELGVSNSNSNQNHNNNNFSHSTNKAWKPKSGVLMRSDEDAEENTWWLDVLSPTDQEMKLLSKVFGIHPLTTEDIQMEETREKIELFRNYYLVCFNSFDQDPYSHTYLDPLNVYIIVFREGTLSFHFRGTPHPQNVRRRIKQLKDYINVTSDWISYALIDDITDAFGPLIQSIEYEVDSIDELVLILKDVEQSDMLRRIGTCRKKVMGLLRLMGNKADVVKGLSKRCNENWLIAPKSDIGLYLSDIQDHLVTMTQNLNHYEKILSRSHSNYLAQISIEMTDANNQINDVLSKLTALGSILVPMNLVTGLWGMNVHVPGQDIAEGYAWFISIVCGLISFGIFGAWATLRYFKFSNNRTSRS